MPEKVLDLTAVQTIKTWITSKFATKEEAGDENTIETVKVNGTALTPDASKAVNVIVPTTTSELTNDSGYQTAANVTTAITDALANSGDPYQTESEVQTLIDSELAGITEIDFQVVTELPATGVKGVIYLLQNETSPTDVYDEYIWITPEGGTARYEQIGTTAVDLSGYWSKEEMTIATVAEINAILNA